MTEELIESNTGNHYISKKSLRLDSVGCKPAVSISIQNSLQREIETLNEKINSLEEKQATKVQ
jgi:hypothetical protein